MINRKETSLRILEAMIQSGMVSISSSATTVGPFEAAKLAVRAADEMERYLHDTPTPLGRRIAVRDG